MMNSPALPFSRTGIYDLRPRRGIACSADGGKALVLGYYGYGNLGDELSLGAIVAALDGYGFGEITVIGRRRYDGLLPTGVRLADCRSPAALAAAVVRCDVLIAGGGTLLQNSTGEKSLIYYTSLIRIAAAMGKRVVLCGGVGPIEGRCASMRAAAALRCCEEIWMRDPAGAAEVKRLCGREANICADPIFFTDYAYRSNAPSEARKNGAVGYVAVQLRRMAGKEKCAKRAMGSTGEAVAVRAAELCRIIRERTGALPLFVSMQDSYDMELSRLAAELCGGEVVSPSTGKDLFDIIGGARAAVGMRLHFLLAAAMSGAPAVALSYDPKVDSAAEMFRLPTFPADRFSPYEVCRAVCSADGQGISCRCTEKSEIKNS